MSRQTGNKAKASRQRSSILQWILLAAMFLLAWINIRLESLSSQESSLINRGAEQVVVISRDTSSTTTIHHTNTSSTKSYSRPFLYLPPNSTARRIPLQHPHWGAQLLPQQTKGSSSQRGYVHNPYQHLTHPVALSISSPEEYQAVCPPPGQGMEGPEGAVGLQKIQTTSSSSSSTHDDRRRPRIFCAIYTFDQRINNTQAIRETWGKRCDGLLFASTVTNETTLHVHMPHQSRFEGSYKGMWQKVRAILGYLGDYFLKDFDFFHICGDDTFVLVDNLRALVSDKGDPERPQLFGFWMHSPDWKTNHKYPKDFYYMGGGSGYTISKAALQQFVQHALPYCQPEKEAPQEDVLVSWCFRSVLNITGMDTRDETGAHRYHQLPINRYMLFPEKKKFGMSTFLFRKALEFMHEYHGFPIVYGLDYISSSSVAFHMLKHPEHLKRYEVLLYNDSRRACDDYRKQHGELAHS